MLKKIESKEKNKKEPKSESQKREKEIRVGPIVFRPSRGDWKCPNESCKNWNYSKRKECNMCGHNQEQTPHNEIVDDWKCHSCGFRNKSSRISCYKCKLEK